MKRRTIDLIRVFVKPGDRRLGRLTAGNLVVRCALGRTGTTRMKREGDGATPLGTFELGQAFYRADRGGRPQTLLMLVPIRPDDGWCEEPTARSYNRHVRLSPSLGADRLKREDHLYDVIVEITYNARPRVRGRGSAIFLHMARLGLAPTAGCVAVRPGDMRKLLPLIGPSTRIEIV